VPLEREECGLRAGLDKQRSARPASHMFCSYGEIKRLNVVLLIFTKGMGSALSLIAVTRNVVACAH